MVAQVLLLQNNQDKKANKIYKNLQINREKRERKFQQEGTGKVVRNYLVLC